MRYVTKKCIGLSMLSGLGLAAAGITLANLSSGSTVEAEADTMLLQTGQGQCGKLCSTDEDCAGKTKCVVIDKNRLDQAPERMYIIIIIIEGLVQGRLLSMLYKITCIMWLCFLKFNLVLLHSTHPPWSVFI